MASIEDITEKLDELKLSDDLFPKFDDILRNSDDDLSINDLVIKKLILIDQYNALRKSIDVSFKEGFINVSRASYSGTSLNKPYGKDYWDEKVQATTRVSVIDGRIGIKKDNDDDVEEDRKEINQKDGIRNRKKSEEKFGVDVKKPKRKYNPINMFGVLVPYQLKQAQTNFNSSINELVELTNVINEIQQINEKINLSKHIKDSTTTL